MPKLVKDGAIVECHRVALEKDATLSDIIDATNLFADPTDYATR